MKSIIKKYPTILVVSLGLGLVACAKEEEDEKKEEAASEVTISGKLALASSFRLLAGTLADYKLYCVSFEETPRAASSEFGDDGAFSVAVPAQVQIGCFVNDKTTNMPKFSFQFETGSESKMGGSSTKGAAFKGNVDLGDLTVNSEGKVVVPAAKIADQKATIAGLDLAAIHDKEYYLKCVTSGNADMDAMCKEQLMDGQDTATVFFRMLKATEGGQEVVGLAVWQSKAAFEGCGSIDLTTAEAASMDGVAFTSASIGDAYTANDETCPVRDEGNAREMHLLKNYYLMSKAVSTGGGYAVAQSSREDHGGECVTTHSTAVEFAGTTSLMTGAFLLEESRIKCTPEGGGDVVPLETSVGAFNVVFEPK